LVILNHSLAFFISLTHDLFERQSPRENEKHRHTSKNRLKRSFGS
jgi:hypothetical protein